MYKMKLFQMRVGEVLLVVQCGQNLRWKQTGIVLIKLR